MFADNTQTSVVRRLQNKFSTLRCESRCDTSTVKDASSVQNRWVINFSSERFTETQMSRLRKGLNFTITPRGVPNDIIVSQFESLPEVHKQGIPL